MDCENPGVKRWDDLGRLGQGLMTQAVLGVAELIEDVTRRVPWRVRRWSPSSSSSIRACDICTVGHATLARLVT